MLSLAKDSANDAKNILLQVYNLGSIKPNANYEKIEVIRAFDVIFDALKRKNPAKLLLFLDEFEEILGDRGEERIKLHSAIEPLSIRNIISYALLRSL